MKKIWKKVVAVSMAAVLMCGCGTGSGAQTGSQEEQGAVQGSQAEENAGGGRHAVSGISESGFLPPYCKGGRRGDASCPHYERIYCQQ